MIGGLHAEAEKAAEKWLSETDAMQFSTEELLAMFAEYWCNKRQSLIIKRKLNNDDAT